MPERCDCLVLRRVRFSETSLVLTLLDRESGRRDALAKGCRRPGTPLYGHLDLHRREECVIYPRRAGLDLVTQATLDEEFHGMGQAPLVFAAASLLAEWASVFCPPREPHPEVFDQMLTAWRTLDRVGRVAADPAPAAAAGLLGLLAAAGFAPRVDGCAGCGVALDGIGGRPRFMSALGGLACRKCAGTGSFGISADAANWLRAASQGQAAAAPGAGPSKAAAHSALLALARFAGEIAGSPLRSAAVFAALGRQTKKT